MPRLTIAYRFLIAAVAALLAASACAQSPDRITRPIDDSRVVTLFGNVHPLAEPASDIGPADPDTRLDSLLLELKPAPSQQSELDSLLAAQLDPHSPLFHRWLTPAEFGARFGASPHDLARVSAWLTAHGFTIDDIPSSRRLIVFSGTAEQVEQAFHLSMRHLRVADVDHIVNSDDPQIPAALAPVVGGIVSLHDFRRDSAIATSRALDAQATESESFSDQPAAGYPGFADVAPQPMPQMTSGSNHYLFPADFAAIYDLNPVFASGIAGAGISIAVAGRSDIRSTDVAAFRAASGLPAKKPQVLLAGHDPGLVLADQLESTLDVEWAGAVAPSANVVFAPAASTATTDGVDLSAAYIVNHALGSVLTVSYGSCEQQMGASELRFYNSLWQQAAAEGISVFVASGDSGAAGCQPGASNRGAGAAVNGLCSSPFATCVGGTEFNEGANPARYWSTANNSLQESALSYIPELVWNESAGIAHGSQLWSSGGGISRVYTQPAWQQGIAGTSQSNGMRAVPDVALSAAAHDSYIIYENGTWWSIAGTSAASPSFAGIMALIANATGNPKQGSANPALYSLADSAPGAFHATPSGNNSVPGVTGFKAAGLAYNLATGLGSVDAAQLIEAWTAEQPKHGTK